MTLRMARRICMADIERMGPCGVEGVDFDTNYSEGIDLTTQPGRDAVQDMYDRGLAVEYGLAVVLDSGQRQRFIATLVEERKTLLEVTTQEEIAQDVLSEDVRRKETAIGIMLDIGTEGKARDLIASLAATTKAVRAFEGDVQAMRDRALAWFFQEALDAVAEGRVAD